MFWIMIIIAVVLGGIGVIFFVKDLQYKKIVLIGLASGALVITLFSSVKTIDSGWVGVVYNFGAITGQFGEGLQVIAPWQDMQLANIQIQNGSFESLDSDSKENQKIFLTNVSVNFQVAPENVQTLYRNVGPNYYEVIIVPRVKNILKDEVVKYEALDVQPEREKLGKDVASKLRKELDQYSITLVDVLIDDITFSADFDKAIEEAQIATQNTLREEQRIMQRRHEAEQAREVARGKADALSIEAQGQALANEALAKSLTPMLIQFQALQKLADDIKIAILPGGQGLIIDPATLLEDPEKRKP
ncbi:MAG: hypothetical protein A3A97_01530 [Candidatus Terrybacteria bacterium RIFCSPLOWO2_01_FULL_40_23]|uniref:Band 7 domain-containing protein n=1 Tax=Candidatus Terrybacteria bacterium RIFCSPLOWO2_01_FULL_40_23 TaxID=1802366 RepID=A0A1G2PR05_9BACT|nr:MAG: hypothetical protein A3A97_01530 [Candidatus Terrybacteria bacterium RIFCSPLOWO2_01_FULL_40_23]